MVRTAKDPGLPDYQPPRPSADDLPDDRAASGSRRRRVMKKRDPLFAGPQIDPSRPIKRQVSFQIPVSDHRVLEHEATRRGCAMVDLVREWMEPHLEKLRAAAQGLS